jgi:hypothetical protein
VWSGSTAGLPPLYTCPPVKWLKSLRLVIAWGRLSMDPWVYRIFRIIIITIILFWSLGCFFSSSCMALLPNLFFESFLPILGRLRRPIITFPHFQFLDYPIFENQNFKYLNNLIISFYSKAHYIK